MSKGISVHFNAGYGRTGTIAVADSTMCDSCNQMAKCLTVDCSEEEYATGEICFPCISDLMQEGDFT